MNRRTVASLSAAGGTGKTSFILQAISAWANGKEFAGFSPLIPLKILGLFAEEEQADIERRLWAVNGGQFPVGLHARSVKGLMGPLMGLKNGCPERTKWWGWLEQTVANHLPLDLLVLDPKSRIYGLDENSNDHNTQWASCLEAISVKHGPAILFTHHVPKNTEEISQWMSRGGSALVDACRANLGMLRLTKKDGEDLGIEEWWSHVRLGVSKINIGPKPAQHAILRFDENGLLQPVNVRTQRIDSMKAHFLYLLSKEQRRYSRRELVKQSEGKRIADRMKKAFPKFARSRDTDDILDLLLEEGLIREENESTSTKGKRVFVLA